MEEAQVTVIMVPLPCQSHLNQLLRLAVLISSHGLPVHYLGSATHNRQVKLRHGLNPNHPTSKIHFHDLPTSPIPTPDPNTDSDKLPVHMAPAISAYFELRRPIAALVRELSGMSEKIVLIYDRYIAEAVNDAVLVPNVESYAFNCLSCFDLFYILWEALGKPFTVEGEPQNLRFSIRDFLPEGVLRFLVTKPEHFRNRAGDIHNTVRSIDGKYIDLLARPEIGGTSRQWAISPMLKPKPVIPGGHNHDKIARHECLAWLDGQAPGSVLYVSFGTSVALSKEEAREIAMGLERSGKKFVWALREADRADIFSGGEIRKIELPEGFEERVKENGIVVRDWAPQVEILAHKSTGGFMTHCGWNSCFESLMTGVPMLAWPMHSDQPLNAIFVTEILRTGLIVRKWEERWDIVKASVIEDVVERLMGSVEGDGIRKRAAEIRAALGREAEEGGELQSFIAHIISG